jgi:hypothetical protein
MSWADGDPMVTAVVRCDPVVRGPDVARGPTWKARLPIRAAGMLRPWPQGEECLPVTTVDMRDGQEPLLRDM